MRKYLEVVQEAQDLHTAGRLQEAARLYDHLLGSQPDDGYVLYLYGTLCLQIKQFGVAITMLRTAVLMELPDQCKGEAWHNLGAAYRNEGHTDAAREAYAQAIKFRPDNPDCYAMMAGAYINTGTPKEAIKWADKALEIDPAHVFALSHKSLALLEMGRFGEAWPYYRSRFDLPALSTSRRPFRCARWEGEEVGKLAIHGEQGIGDEIMWMSCFDEIKHLAREIVIECEPRLIPLLERSFGVQCYGTHDELIAAHPDVEAYAAMGDMAEKTRQALNDFPGTPYLKPDLGKVIEYRQRLEAIGPGPYIGIAWHGGVKGTHQELRNPPNDLWKSLMDRGGQFVSIQYGDHGPAQAVEFGVPHVQDMIDNLDNFAALVQALDLVISPCQTAIHFAGALGKECWCVTPSAPAWRYGIKGPMPWYKSVRLYRQPHKDWQPVFNQVSKDLADFIVLHRAESAAA